MFQEKKEGRIKITKMYSSETIAAISHFLLRILVLLLVEDECARLIQQHSGLPAVAGNYILAGLFSLGLLGVLIIPKIKIGYIIGIIAGISNIIAKLIVLAKGHEFFPNRPSLYILQSFIVAFFCFVALKKLSTIKKQSENI